MGNKKKRNSFTRAYNDYYPLVYNRVYKLCGKREDTEDICHEVFLLFYKKFEEIDEKRNWLMAVARNQTAMYYRKKKNKKSDIDIKEFENDITHSFVNGTKELRIILSDEIKNPANYSDETEQTLFELIALLKYSYKEAAEQLGLSQRQIAYRYEKITKRIVDNLRVKGLKKVDDLL
jgi:RNA polymerase sigma-70 factor, ECF subfamily